VNSMTCTQACQRSNWPGSSLGNVGRRSPRHDGGVEATRSCDDPSSFPQGRFPADLQQNLQHPRELQLPRVRKANLSVHQGWFFLVFLPGGLSSCRKSLSSVSSTAGGTPRPAWARSESRSSSSRARKTSRKLIGHSAG